MTSYIRYFENVISSILKSFTDKEYLLPVSNTEDSVKCKDFDMDNDNLVCIRRHIYVPYRKQYESYYNSV
jgi:hypothetical protein